MGMTGHPPDVPLPNSWRNRKVVTAALWDLVNDFDKNANRWENTELPAYLEALCALLESIENSYANNGRPLPDDPWIVMADAIKGARFYE
ncbi:DUF7660 family protein [Intrasporangium mesophilum]